MKQAYLHDLKPLRKCLTEKGKSVFLRRLSPENAELRRRMDKTLLAFRVARAVAAAQTASETGSWLRAIRQAVGIPVDVVAHRLGVQKGEVLRLERVEAGSRIGLEPLRRAAEALGCELVYALVPRQGSLEDLAAQEYEEREAARAKACAMEAENKEQAEELIGWDTAVRRMFRGEMRKMGIRVR